MNRLTFMLSETEAEALRKAAAHEYRPPRDHARMLLMQALGFVEGESRTINRGEVMIYEQAVLQPA